MIQTDLRIIPELAQSLEESEALYWSKYFDIDGSLKCYATTCCGAFVGAVPEVDILLFNRVIGLGMREPVSHAHIDDIIQFYEKAGSKRFFIQLSPYIRQDDLPDMLMEKGFRHYNNWVKLLRPVNAPVPEVDSGLTVQRITEQDAHIFGQIIVESFDWEDTSMADWLAHPVGKPGYRHYAAYWENKPVAVAALHTHGIYASLAFAGTRAEYRSLGAQSLLLRTRIEEARTLGCRYLITETAQPTVEKPVTSYNNMRRFGFEEAYLRPNWLYEG